MTGTKKMRIAHVFSAICAMLAILLLILLFYTPLFNPGHFLIGYAVPAFSF
mgnify:FL=1